MSIRFAFALLVPALAATASADPFSFVDWDKTTQTATSISGVIQSDQGPIGVTLTGGFTDVLKNFDVYNPATTYIGGIVGNQPDVKDFVRIDTATPFTLAFSRPVTNLAYDLWSVGQGGVPVSYAFTQPFSLVAGGPNANFGGSSLVKNGNTVTGQEGNGVLLFTGTYSSISWDVIGNEGYHGFTIGLSNAQPVPEPATMAALALGGLGLLRRRKRAS